MCLPHCSIALFSLFRSNGDNTDLVQTDVYRYVHHPLYTGVILSLLKYANEQNLSFLFSIQSAVGHLPMSSVTSLCVILGVWYFKEPALMKSLCVPIWHIGDPVLKFS